MYFRLLLLGFLLGLDSERRIALQACDSLSLRRFLGYALQEATPDPSTLSRTRRRIPVETHEQVFGWCTGPQYSGGRFSDYSSGRRGGFLGLFVICGRIGAGGSGRVGRRA